MAITDGSVVLMGADSASTDETFEHVTRAGCSKAWVQDIPGFGLALIGFTGNFASGMWIRHGFVWPKKSKTSSFEKYLVVEVQPAIVKSLCQRFVTETDENRHAWCLLVASPCGIFKLHACGDVESTVLPFSAVGDASSVAFGTLFALQDSDIPSWEKLEMAFRACFASRASVRGPLHILALGRNGILHI